MNLGYVIIGIGPGKNTLYLANDRIFTSAMDADAAAVNQKTVYPAHRVYVACLEGEAKEIPQPRFGAVR